MLVAVEFHLTDGGFFNLGHHRSFALALVHFDTVNTEVFIHKVNDFLAGYLAHFVEFIAHLVIGYIIGKGRHEHVGTTHIALEGLDGADFFVKDDGAQHLFIEFALADEVELCQQQVAHFFQALTFFRCAVEQKESVVFFDFGHAFGAQYFLLLYEVEINQAGA